MKATFKDRIKALVTIAYVVVGNYRAYQRRLENERLQFRIKGDSLRSNATARANACTRCNHRKGGRWDFHKTAASGVIADLPSAGDDSCYAVIKHTMANGDVWVICQRCGKKWKPGDEGYANALSFRTNNAASTSIRYQFADNGRGYRNLLRNV